MRPPKPPSRPDRVALWTHFRLIRRDILSAQPERLYRAKMAVFRTPFFRSFLVNDPDLVREILVERPEDFPKSPRVTAGLKPFLGDCIFLSNGTDWEHQRRIVAPAFAQARLPEMLPGILEAGEAACARIAAAEGPVEVEAEMTHLAADVIFRALFSVPIEDRLARAFFAEFRAYQRAQPILGLRALMPRAGALLARANLAGRARARRLRAMIAEMVDRRQAEIAAGTAPDDVATRIATGIDAQTGQGFTREEIIDQIAVFFLAGHETTSSALAWSLYLLAADPDWQAQVRAEARQFTGAFAQVRSLSRTRDSFREALRLYPPVPMLMVREARVEGEFRGRRIRPGDQIVIAPWYLHRHADRWPAPDDFDPARWQRDATRPVARENFLPFSTGPRACTGAGFAMLEGVALLALIVSRFAVRPAESTPPLPVAHITVRSEGGIRLLFERCMDGK